MAGMANLSGNRKENSWPSKGRDFSHIYFRQKPETFQRLGYLLLRFSFACIRSSSFKSGVAKKTVSLPITLTPNKLRILWLNSREVFMDTPFVYLRATLEELQRRSPPTPVPSEFTPELLSGILSRDPNPDVDCMRVLAQIDEGYSNRVDLVFPSEADFAAATLPPFVDGVALTNLSSAIMLQNHVKIPVGE